METRGIVNIRMEFAENYGREKHVIRYKPDHPAVEHLVMHELVHLDFVIQARKTGVSEQNIAGYCNALFEGFNRQVFNAPIDLFIEEFLYRQFPEIRAWQFLSLYNIIREGIQAVTDKKAAEVSPKEILSKSRIYNLVGAFQFKALYGIDLTGDFQATPGELKQAEAFYEEYLEYKDDRKPAEEYELLLHWAQDLKADPFFELVNETEYRTRRTDIDGMLESIENDPYDLASKDPYKKREMERFQESQKSGGANMAVVMFMLGARPARDARRVAAAL